MNAYQTLPIPLEESNTQVQHAESLRAFNLPERDLDIRIAIKHWILKARKRFNLNAETLPLPKLSYKLRGNTLGQAWYTEHQISLNPLYIEHHLYEIINDTIPHEVCHLVAGKIYGHRNIFPHGEQWQQVCIDLGHSPRRCNNQVASYKVLKQTEAQVIGKMTAEDF